jgi:hypothetical protein
MQNFDGEILRNGKLVSKGPRGVGFECMMSLCISRVEYSITRIVLNTSD